MWITDHRARAAAVLLLLAPVLGSAQSGAGDLGRALFAAGTTTTNAAGQAWAYVFWQVTDRSLLQDQSFSVFRKNGAAGSASSFEPVGVVRVQQDARAVKMLVDRAVNLGSDAATLGSAIDELFSGAGIDAGLPIEEKILAVILSSYADDKAFDKLQFLARRQPALAMAMGTALAIPIPAGGPSTFEIRLTENGTAADVVGRVTVDPLNPLFLPAPNALVEVPDTSPMGHLNVRLRWSEPDALKRVALLQFGYNVYRADQATAAALGWTNSAPTRTNLLAQLIARSNEVVKVNRLPVMADIDGTNAFFLADDHDRFLPGGTPFADGSRYYYFVTAADLLGRPGLVSTGLSVRICDRTPPLLPRNLATDVIRSYGGGVASNHLRIRWRQIQSESGLPIQYYVFRWSSISQLTASATSGTSSAIAGPIAHVTGEVFQSYTDTNTPAALTTSWYTVQAAEITSCGTNLSGHSAPHGGFIPDLTGPGAPATTARIRIVTCRVDIDALPADRSFVHETPLVLTCTRPAGHTDIAWVDFSVLAGSKGLADFPAANYIGRYAFSVGSTQVLVAITNAALQNGATFYGQAGLLNGQVSDIAFRYGSAEQSVSVRLPFVAQSFCQGSVVDRTNDVHRPTGSSDPGITNTLIKPEIDFGPIPTNAYGHHFLLHQQVDGGPLTLIGQFLVESNLLGAVTTLTNDMAGTLGCSEICLYQEQVDEHGFSSGQQLIGCYQSTVLPPPAPDLLPIDPVGTTTNPSMRLTWFCPPAGVERFEVAIGLEDVSPPQQFIASLTTNLSPDPNPVVIEGRTLRFGSYQTGRVGQNFGTPDVPDFAVELPIELGKEYHVQLISIDACGNRSASPISTFAWYPPPTGPDVPWPARPLPPVSPDFHPDLQAVFLKPSNYMIPSVPSQMVGVRIGVVTQALYRESTCHEIPGLAEPTSYLFPSVSSGERLLPIALYRYQITNATLRRASGDVAQVSPLIEEIAYEFNSPGVRICDPFIRFLTPSGNANAEEAVYQIFLLDTQPVISGASYVYLVVQFGNTREPSRIIPLDPITIP